MNLTFSCLKNNSVQVNSPSCDVQLRGEEKIENLQNTDRHVLVESMPNLEDTKGMLSGGHDVKAIQYFTVINFSTNKKFHLKVKNKKVVKKWDDWTTQDQMTIFKRHINSWRKIAEGDIRIVPEFTKACNIHFNLIYKSILPVKDIDIIITDAYNVEHATRRYFVKTKPVEDLNGLNIYLKKQTSKQYQYTGIEWLISNV